MGDTCPECESNLTYVDDGNGNEGLCCTNCDWCEEG